VFLWCLPAQAQIEYPFLGCWDWAGTSYPDGSSDTPASIGYSIQICFHPGHTFVRFHDEVVFESSTWGVGELIIWPYFVEFLETGVGDYWHWTVLGGPPQFEMRLSDSVDLPGGVGGTPSFTEVYFSRGTVSTEARSWGGLKATYK